MLDRGAAMVLTPADVPAGRAFPAVTPEGVSGMAAGAVEPVAGPVTGMAAGAAG
jgi:hypothetical protein